MPLTNVDTTSGTPGFAQGPTTTVRSKSLLESMAPSISKGIQEGIGGAIDAARKEDAANAVDKLYESAVLGNPATGDRFQTIVARAKVEGAYAPYIKKLKELKAQADQGITNQDAVAVAAEAMLKEAMVNNPGTYDILLDQVQKQLGINPSGYLLRLEGSVAEQMKRAQANKLAKQMARDEKLFNKELDEFVKYSGLGVYQAKTAIEAALPHIKDNIYDDWNKLPAALKRNPYLQYRRDRAIEESNRRHLSNLKTRLETRNTETSLAAERLHPIVGRMADTVVAGTVQKLNNYHKLSQEAKNSGRLEEALQYQRLARNAARELVDKRQSLMEGAGTLNKVWLIQTGLVPENATDEEIAKFRNSPAGKAIQAYDFENNPLIKSVSDLTIYYTSGKGDSDTITAGEITQLADELSLLSLYQTNPRLPAAMAVGAKVGPIEGAIGKLLKDAITGLEAADAYQRDNLPKFIQNLSSKYAVANGLPVPDTEEEPAYANKAAISELKTFLENEGDLGSSVPEEERYRHYAKLANIALNTTDRAYASDVRQFFKLLGKHPKVIHRLVSDIQSNEDMPVSAKRGALSKVATGIYDFSAEVEGLFTEYKGASWFPKDAHLTFDNGLGEASIKWLSPAVTYGKYRPIKRDASKLKPVIADALNAEKAMLLLQNPNLVNDSITVDGKTIDNLLNKLAAISVSMDYGLPRVSNIDDAEYEALSKLLNEMK